MLSKPALSGVVITFNEADRIERCVASLVPVCHEVIVLDSGSTDGTAAIARAAGARVEQRPWEGFAKQKNAAIALASQPWVMLLDADEWLEPDAQQAVRALFDRDIEASDVWLLLRRTHYLGHAMRGGSFAREPVQRLFRSHLRHAIRPVHEYLDVQGQRETRSSVRLEHDTARNPDEYWRKLQRYARLWADEQAARGRSALPGRGAMAALAYAIKNLIVRGGLIDGLPGLRFHVMHMRYARLKYTLLREAGR
ncbi:glycosyltransferase family 2 protein [Lysobacter korlensis]|uniref:Glycosyltransferase family 2 protein n=1 Tax=Lysobacter korlensis TaxID=553636 RepID=A0ABV6RI00_9GAMM